MKKITILAALLLGMLGGVYAQDSNSSSADYAPAAGDLSGAILFGRGNFLNSGLIVPRSPSPYGWQSVSGASPQNNTVGTDNNSVGNIVGAELRYFLQQNIAIKLSGGAILSNAPARGNSPAVVMEGTDGNTVVVPAYDAVVADNSADINVNLGGEYHFSSKYSRLYPYAGVTLPFYYSRKSLYDPTIVDGDGNSNPFIVDAGTRHAEIVGFGAQAVGGVDYYLLEGLYFGFEIKPVSYVYSYSTKVAAPGLGGLQADNHSVSFFSQTFLKVGFRF